MAGEWNISGTKDLGFSGDYAAQIKAAMDRVSNQQYNDTNQMAMENSLAGGSFNPNLSTYYATKGARETQASGKLAGINAGREDEYKRFGVMNSINNFNLQDKYFNLQNEQYQDSKPGFWDDLFGGISTLSGVLPFLRKGGKVDGDTMKWMIDVAMKHYAEGGDVKSSDYFQKAFDGAIPSSEVNSEPASSGDNVMIMAKDGERIIRPEADKMTGGATQLINDAVDMIKGLIN